MWLPFNTVYAETVRLFGRGEDTFAAGNLAKQNQVAGNIAWRVRKANEYAWWRALLFVEERTIVVTDDIAHIPLEETGKTTIYMVPRCAIYGSDPRLSENPGELSHTQDQTLGLIVRGPGKYVAGDKLWAVFRGPNQVFTRTPWDNATDYAVGDVVLEGNDCYLATAPSGPATSVEQPPNTSFWKVQQVPEFQREYVRRGAFADWLRNDGQREKGLLENDFAKGELRRLRRTQLAGLGIFTRASATMPDPLTS